jgi:hypothetical protein
MVCNPESPRTSIVETEGEERRSPVPGRLTAVRSPGTGVGRNRRKAAAGEFQEVEAPSDVGKDLADNWGLGDEAHDTHSLAATTQ